MKKIYIVKIYLLYEKGIRHNLLTNAILGHKKMVKGGKPMKNITMFIRPEKLETAKKILIDDYQCGGMTVSNVMGCGNQKGYNEEYKNIRTNVNLLPKLKIEVFTFDENVDGIISAACELLSTGKPGDGKIYVTDIEYGVRIRTKERIVEQGK